MSRGPAGYVYVLINYSMPGVVKIGRTERPTAARLMELSSATGVPTPFELVYDVFVEDCAAAEATLHRALTLRGYRVSDNREFFQAPIREVIEMMIALAPASEPSRTLRLERSADHPSVVLLDPLYPQAVELCAQRSTVSAADFMRAFTIGFSRAQAIVEELRSAGLIEVADPIGPHRTRRQGGVHGAG